jgi:purine-binding chemotaxis protein CheW
MSEAEITGARQYLTFTLGSELFGLNVLHVREILEFTRITQVPGSQEFMRGVTNVRGTVVPIMDMKLKFGLGRTEPTMSTCIILIEAAWNGEYALIGTLADSVQEVLELTHEQIEPVPGIGTHLKTEFINGMGKLDENIFILLDMEKIFSLDEPTPPEETSENLEKVI